MLQKMKIKVIRTYFNQDYTKGIMIVNDVFFGYTLEPQRKGSGETSFLNRCIEAGKYVAKYEYSQKFKKKLIELKNVPSHTEIKIHSGNFRSNTQGCILVGLRSDRGCVLDSKIAVEMLNEIAKRTVDNNENIEVEIKDDVGVDDVIDFNVWRDSGK